MTRELAVALAKLWRCNECGRLMTIGQAYRAIAKGCTCGSTDVDLRPLAEVAA